MLFSTSELITHSESSTALGVSVGLLPELLLCPFKLWAGFQAGSSHWWCWAPHAGCAAAHAGLTAAAPGAMWCEKGGAGFTGEVVDHI